MPPHPSGSGGISLPEFAACPKTGPNIGSRLARTELLNYSSGPALGNLESGAMTSAFNVRVSVVSGGILCVVGTLLMAAFLSVFWHYYERRKQAGESGMDRQSQQEKSAGVTS